MADEVGVSPYMVVALHNENIRSTNQTGNFAVLQPFSTVPARRNLSDLDSNPDVMSHPLKAIQSVPSTAQIP